MDTMLHNNYFVNVKNEKKITEQNFTSILCIQRFYRITNYIIYPYCRWYLIFDICIILLDRKILQPVHLSDGTLEAELSESWLEFIF